MPSSPVMTPMQLEIMSKALDLLLLVVEREAGDGGDSGAAAGEKKVAGASGGAGATESKRAERQSAVAGAESGLLSEMLAHVGFSRAEMFCRTPMACRERAMRVTGSLVDGHASNQYQLGEVRYDLSVRLGFTLSPTRTRVESIESIESICRDSRRLVTRSESSS